MSKATKVYENVQFEFQVSPAELVKMVWAKMLGKRIVVSVEELTVTTITEEPTDE